MTSYPIQCQGPRWVITAYMQNQSDSPLLEKAHYLTMILSYCILFLVALSRQCGKVKATSFRGLQKSPPLVTIENGTLSSLYEDVLQQDLFLGIPYVLPPNGQRRFAMPAPAAAWNRTLHAHSYKDWCPGNPTGLPGFTQETNATMSEDCLHINVIRPSGTDSRSELPVLV